jgi:hypothetical protein
MFTKWLPTYNSWWQEVTLIFVLSRLGIVLVTIASIALLSQYSKLIYVPDVVDAHYRAHDLWSYLYAWWRWDAVHLTNIATYGYQHDKGSRAFLPLFPLLQRGTGDILRLMLQPTSTSGVEATYYFAGMILANVCCYSTMMLCYALTENELGTKVARLTVLFLALYPYSIFLFAGYTESLFLLLTVAVFFFLQRSHWWLAGICAALLLLTRVAGEVIGIPFLILYIQRFWPQWRKLILPWREMILTALPAMIIPVGLGIYMVYLYRIWHDPFIFRTAEESWNRHISVPGYGLYLDLKVLTTIKLKTDETYTDIMDMVFSIGPISALLLSRKRLSLHYWLFSLAMAIFSISTYAIASNPARCYPRFMMVAFPLFMLYAQWSKTRLAVLVPLVLCFLILLAVNIMLFVTGHWIA